MTENTINADVTMGGTMGTLLAGRYRVVRQLGQGGMGSVWLAEDTQLDDRKVAIKMLPSILVSNKRAYQQLKAEALVSLKLTHSNIAAVRAFEENGGNPFLVVDYIDGQTLDDYLAEKGKLTEDETVRLLAPVAAALDYAHTKGVVHRDVKPANVMIAMDGTPYVLDFGIAREVQETLTRVTGKLSSGTLLYMSPEQLHGAAPTPAQDVYSFSAMAYECLTGRPPFSRGQVEYQIEHDAPAPLDPNIAICGSVMAGLAKDAAGRPPSCFEVVEKGCVAKIECDGEVERDELSSADSSKDINSGVLTSCDDRSVRRHGRCLWGIVSAWLVFGLAVVSGLFGYQAYRFHCEIAQPSRTIENYTTQERSHYYTLNGNFAFCFTLAALGVFMATGLGASRRMLVSGSGMRHTLVLLMFATAVGSALCGAHAHFFELESRRQTKVTANYSPEDLKYYRNLNILAAGGWGVVSLVLLAVLTKRRDEDSCNR